MANNANRKQLLRMELNGVDVTVLSKGRRMSKIRDQYGYVREVATKDLKSIDDEDRRYVTVAEDPDGW